MKNRTNTSSFTRSILALALVLTLAIWSPIQAQSAESAKGKKMVDEKMIQHCQEMKEQKHKMMEEMKAQDAELTKQVNEMNSAPEDKKMSLMAAVITRMVEQRAAMHAQKAKMEEEMMKHMAEHRKMSKGAMSHCPMMEEMKGMDETSAGAPK